MGPRKRALTGTKDPGLRAMDGIGRKKPNATKRRRLRIRERSVVLRRFMLALNDL